MNLYFFSKLQTQMLIPSSVPFSHWLSVTLQKPKDINPQKLSGGNEVLIGYCELIFLSAIVAIRDVKWWHARTRTQNKPGLHWQWVLAQWFAVVLLVVQLCCLSWWNCEVLSWELFSHSGAWFVAWTCSDAPWRKVGTGPFPSLQGYWRDRNCEKLNTHDAACKKVIGIFHQFSLI